MPNNDDKNTESLMDIIHEMWKHPETAGYALRVQSAVYRLVEDVKKGVNEAWVAALDAASEKVRQIKEI